MSVILPQSIQQGIQEALPVIPNNGNPGGANNMPAAEQQQQAAPPPDPYAWLKPSPYMDQVQTMLQQQSEKVDVLYEEMVNPQNNQNYNYVFRQGQLHVMPLNDFQLPLGSNVYTEQVDVLNNQLPSNVPILPGE